MSPRTRSSSIPLVLCAVLVALASVAFADQGNQSGGTSGAASRSAPGSTRASASAPRGSGSAGQRVQQGTQLSGSRRAVPQRLTLGSTLAGSKVAGSKVGGSKIAKQGLGSRVAGSKVAQGGSKVGVRTGLGSKVAGSQVGQGSQVANRAGLGSKVAGSQVSHGSQVANRAGLGSTLAGSQVGQGGQTPAAGSMAARPPSGRFNAIVPALSGPVPRVSTSNPGLVLFLFDASGSMGGDIAGTPGVTKADAAAEAANNTIMEFVLAHRGGDGNVRNRVQVSQLEYGDTVRAGLGADTVALADLANNPADFITSQDAQGQPTQLPIWLRPQARGGTPMRAAFSKARGIFQTYLGQGAGADRRPRLLIGFNITDGESTDGDPSSDLASMAQAATAAGDSFIMTNIHVSSNPNAAPVLFPTEEQAAGFDDYGKKLFEMSSPVPDALMPLVRELNPDAGTGTGPRMMAVNANLEGLNSVVQVGSSLAAGAPPAAP